MCVMLFCQQLNNIYEDVTKSKNEKENNYNVGTKQYSFLWLSFC